MAFTKKHIAPRILCIVDIWTYKIRACLAKYKNTQIELIHYCEKRQDSSYFSHGECTNISWVSQNIRDILSRIESETDTKIEEVICNIAFGDIISSHKTLNYKRDNEDAFIWLKEFEHIIEVSEKLALKKLEFKAEWLLGMDLKDMHIVFSDIIHVKLDGKNEQKILQQHASTLSLWLLNIALPRHHYLSHTQLFRAIGRNIHHLLPVEYGLVSLFEEKNIVVIHVGAQSTSIILKKDGVLYNIGKISVGIENLVTKIQKNHGISAAKALDSLDQENYTLERTQFLAHWSESVLVSLYELLSNTLCPKHFFLCGGWAQNDFIRKEVQEFDLWEYDIKHTGNIFLLHEDMSKVLQQIQGLSLEHIQKIPLEVYVLLLETQKILTHEQDLMSHTLKNVMKKLGY